MDIRKIFKTILETESAVPVNAIAGGEGIKMYDPILKLRRKVDPTAIKSGAHSGPTRIPGNNSVSNSLNNGNKGVIKDPFLEAGKHDPVMKSIQAKLAGKNKKKFGAKQIDTKGNK